MKTADTKEWGVAVGGGAKTSPPCGDAHGLEGWDRMRDTELEMLYQEEPVGGVDREWIRDGVLLYRTKTIKSGDMIEAVCFPYTGHRSGARAAREHVTRAAQQRVNMRNARRRILRKVQCNFGPGAAFVTLTYAEMPREEQAEKELDRYLARLRGAAKKDGGKLQYVAVTEISSTGRVHHHILVEGVTRETAERKWRKGFVNSRQYQANPSGFAGLVAYMLKKNSTVRGSNDEDEEIRNRRIRCSKGLKEPRESVSDHKISKSRMERIACEAEEQGREIFERLYPGYEMRERPTVLRSEWMPGAYVYARLWKKGAVCRWGN